MMIQAFRYPLFDEAGEGAGAGGDGSNAGAPAPGAGAGTAEPPDWAKTLIARLEGVESKLGKVEPPKVESPKGDPSAPAWAQAIAADIAGLKQAKLEEQVAARRGAVTASVLTALPEATRTLGKAVLDGMLGSVAIDGNTDTTKLAAGLAEQLRQQYPVLFVVPGSTRSVVQAGPDGKVDWSRVNSFDDVPEELISSIPHDVMTRIAAGGRSGESAGLPHNLFQKH